MVTGVITLLLKTNENAENAMVEKVRVVFHICLLKLFLPMFDPFVTIKRLFHAKGVTEHDNNTKLCELAVRLADPVGTRRISRSM